jgi:hypothetical protein
MSMSQQPTPAAHPEYTASALSWVSDGAVQLRRSIIVQCPTVDHTHTDKLTVKAETVEDPEVGLAWMVKAEGPNGMNAMEAAYLMAKSLAPLLPGAPKED